MAPRRSPRHRARRQLRSRFAAALLGGASLLLGGAAPAEEIALFRAEILLGRGDRFLVVETIDYDFGATPRHGVERVIPRRQAGDPEGALVGIRVLGVEDEGGSPRPFEVSLEGWDLRIRIGDPDRTVTGVHRYVLRYQVDGAILFHPDSEKLYWNLVGDRWRVPIRRAEGRVFLPEGLPAGSARIRCFAGPRGSRDERCRAYAGDRLLEVESRGALAPGENLTVSVLLPGGTLARPGALRRLLRQLSWWGAGWLLLPLAAGVLLFTWWRRAGRDPEGAGSVPVVYEPPEGLAPAEVGTILDERFDPQDLAATILDLAIRGWLEIAEVPRKEFLFLSGTDYRLELRPAPADSLRPFEEELLGALFDGRETVLVSSLRNRFYRAVPRIERALFAGLTGPGGYFPSSPARIRRNFTVAAVAIYVLGSLWGFAARNPLPGIASGLVAVLVFAFGRIMPRRTRRGRAALEQILGFREFVERVDRDRLERLGARTTERFERLLPHAVVLGVADAWAEAFSDLLVAPPSWYRPGGTGSFHPRGFVSDLGRGLDTVGRTLTSSPRGSGSGGSAGGGFGGGGGGSW